MTKSSQARPFAAKWSNERDFRCWHEPDLQRCLQFGRYRGKTRHGADSPIRSRMTHFGVAVERRLSVQVSPHLAATRSLRLDKPLKRGIS
jgi:hypothetical protein